MFGALLIFLFQVFLFIDKTGDRYNGDIIRYNFLIRSNRYNFFKIHKATILLQKPCHFVEKTLYALDNMYIILPSVAFQKSHLSNQILRIFEKFKKYCKIYLKLLDMKFMHMYI